MCVDPGTALAIGSTALQIGGAIAGDSAENKQAKANKKAALDALRIQRNDLSVRAVEETTAAEQAIEAGAREARGAAGIANVSAAEAGVAGMSVDALLGGISRDAAQQKMGIKDNLVVTIDQLERMKTGAEAEAASRIASVPGANPFATALKIGGSVLDLTTRIQSRKPKGS